MTSLSVHPSRHRLAAAVLLALIMGVGTAAADTDVHFASKTAHVPAATGGAIVRASAPTPSAPEPSRAEMPAVLKTSTAAAAAVALPTASAAPAAAPAPAMPANDPVPMDDSNFYVREAALQREKTLLTLQGDIANLKKKIADAQDGGASIPTPSVIVAPPASLTPQSGVPGAPPMGSVSSVTLPSASEEPAMAPMRLASVLGVGGDFQAVIYDHGVQTSVHEGSVLSDGWRVTKLAPSTAVLVRGRSRKILHVSGG